MTERVKVVSKCEGLDIQLWLVGDRYHTQCGGGRVWRCVGEGVWGGDGPGP